MKLEQYGDKVTRGSYLIDHHAMRMAFPELNNGMIEYVLSRRYLKDNSNRFRISNESAFGISHFPMHDVVLSARSVTHGEDEFNPLVGENIVQFKLHKKAFDFMSQFHGYLKKEIEDLALAVEHCKIPDFASYEDFSEFGFDVFTGTSDNVSVMKVKVPFNSDDEDCDYFPSIEYCVNRFIDAVRDRMLTKGGEFVGGKEAVVDDFIASIEEKFREAVGNEIHGNTSRDEYGCIYMMKKVRRNPDDENDENYALHKLEQKLMTYWVSVNKKMKRILIRILREQANFRISGRVVKKANRCLERCRNLGFECGAPDGFDFNSYNKKEK